MKERGWVKSEHAAQLYALATGGAAVVPWMDTVSMWLKFGSLAVGFLTAVATLSYYVPLAIEKWQQLLAKRKNKKQE